MNSSQLFVACTCKSSFLSSRGDFFTEFKFANILIAANSWKSQGKITAGDLAIKGKIWKGHGKSSENSLKCYVKFAFVNDKQQKKI